MALTDLKPSHHEFTTWQRWLLLGGVAFVTHFLLFPQFGLYEDDYIYTISSFNWSFIDWARQAWDAIIHPVQSRPLNHFARRTLFFLTLQGNSLELAYLASWALITTNACLLYRLLAGRLSAAAGAAGALLYLVHPADNARQIIMHQTDIHLGALLLLGSLNLFHDRRPLLAWIVGGASLINYESFYLPLVIAPLLLFPAPLREWRRAALHVAVWIGIICTVIVVRLVSGEARVIDASGNPAAVARNIAGALLIGPGTSLRLLLQRPWDAALHLTPLLGAGALVVGSVSYRLLNRPSPVSSEMDPRGSWHWPLLAGLLGLVATYLFAFRPGYYPPIVSIGRLSALHAPGVICTAFAAGALWHGCTRVPRLWLSRSLAALAATSFGLLTAFAIQIQLTEYVAHWTKQRDFWREIISQSPDLADNDVILVDVEGSGDVIPITPGFPRFGSVNYPVHALSRFVAFPAAWQHPPRVYGLWAETPATPTDQGLSLATPPYFGPDAQPTLRPGAFLFFRAEGGRLRRVTNPIEIRGNLVSPKPAPAATVTPAFQLSPLYRQLVEPRDGRNWFTIRDSRNYPQ